MGASCAKSMRTVHEGAGIQQPMPPEGIVAYMEKLAEKSRRSDDQIYNQSHRKSMRRDQPEWLNSFEQHHSTRIISSNHDISHITGDEQSDEIVNTQIQDNNTLPFTAIDQLSSEEQVIASAYTNMIQSWKIEVDDKISKSEVFLDNVRLYVDVINKQRAEEMAWWKSQIQSLTDINTRMKKVLTNSSAADADEIEKLEHSLKSISTNMLQRPASEYPRDIENGWTEASVHYNQSQRTSNEGLKVLQKAIIFLYGPSDR